jgi:WD40 repeat protein
MAPATQSKDDPALHVLNLAFSGDQIVSVTANGTVQAWDRTGTPVGRPFTADSGGRSAPVLRSDGTLLATATNQGTVQAWDVTEGKPAGPSISMARGDVTTLAFRGERIVARGSGEDALRQWNLVGGAPEGDPIQVGEKAVTALAFSQDGGRIAVAQEGAKVSVWDATNGKPITTTPMIGDYDPNLDDRRVTSVAFSHDGDRVVTGASGDDTVRVWDAQSGKPIGQPITGHQRNVTSVAFSPDGRYIVSGAQDNSVRLWDANNQQPVGPKLPIYKAAPAVAFSPDGRIIVAGLNDGTIRTWPGPAVWSAELCDKLTHTMNSEQWADWVAASIDYEPVCDGLQTQPGRNGS